MPTVEGFPRLKIEAEEFSHPDYFFYDLINDLVLINTSLIKNKLNK